MSEVISPYALTTLQRVKDRLSNAGVTQNTTFDTVLTRMINSVSTWFEQQCGTVNFVQRTYTNEIYSMYSPKTKKIILRNAPVFFTTVTGNISGAVISQVSNTTGMVVGMPIFADVIPQTPTPTVITSINGSTVGISRSGTSGVTGVSIQVNGIINFQYRAGPPSAPSWTSFIPDQYELVNDGRAGILRIYGILPDFYTNMARLTYSAGYPVNWANAGDGVTHMLPADVTDCVENMVVRRFKRRLLAGKGSEALEGATTSWNKEIDQEDQDVIDNNKRMPTVF